MRATGGTDHLFCVAMISGDEQDVVVRLACLVDDPDGLV